MEFEKLISISGQGSLFMIVSRTGFGLVAESLEDNKRIPVYQSHNVSTLDDISIYTKDGDMPLREVFLKIFEKEGGKACPDAKESNDKVKQYFESVLPEYDEDRVYVSDMKKVLKWYNQLIKGNHIDAESLKRKEEEPAEGDQPEQEEATTGKKKTAKKEAAADPDEKAPEKDKKKEPKKETKKKTVAPKVAKSAGPVKNAPAKKVQGVRKAGGS